LEPLVLRAVFSKWSPFNPLIESAHFLFVQTAGACTVEFSSPVHMFRVRD
jgi:hypothetical protein